VQCRIGGENADPAKKYQINAYTAIGFLEMAIENKTVSSMGFKQMFKFECQIFKTKP
jgi:hypothetical protein